MVKWKEPLRHVLARMGWEMRRSPDTFFIARHGIDLVLDVGANEGQFAEGLRQRGYKGEIRSFEPASDAFRILADKARNDPHWHVTRTALGDAEGQAELNLSGLSVFNSFKKLSQFGEAAHELVGVQRTEQVPVARLDQLVQDTAGRKVFLKIDVQGFEREVLDGAGQVLLQAEGVMLELPMSHLYTEVWSFLDALHYMNDRGFVPAQFRQVVWMPKDPSSAMEFDCVFRRRES